MGMIPLPAVPEVPSSGILRVGKVCVVSDSAASSSTSTVSIAVAAIDKVLSFLAIASALAVALACWWTFATPLEWLIVCFAAGALLTLFPSSVLAAFLVALPIFGNRAGTPQAIALIALASHLVVGTALRRRSFSLKRESAVTSLGVGYVLVSILSLLGMPHSRWYYSWVGKVPALDDLGGWLHVIAGQMHVSEHSLQYPLVSVVLTLWAFQLGTMVLCQVAHDQSQALRFARAVLLGLALSCGVGLADYYGLVSLSSLRSLDPIVNPGGQQFRMQSFFGHSGWFAEYITLTIPFVLTLLTLRWRFSTRVVAILLFLLLGELVLILTFQRGGWLSYPLTLMAVWAAIYITRKLEHGETNILAALRSSALKIAISLPLTVVASVLLLSVATTTTTGEAPLSERYMSRFLDIGKTSDRTEFFMAGFLIGTLNPFLGNGSESFAYHFAREFNEPGGAFPGRYTLPLHGSAHNVYMQTFSGKGVAGLLLLVGTTLAILVLGLRAAIYERALNLTTRVVLLALSCFAAAFFIYGNVQEVFYIQSLQYLFFAVWGLAAALIPCRRNHMTAILLFILACVLAHAALGRRYAPIDSYGCYAPAPRTRWCGTEARQRFPTIEDGGRYYVRFTVMTPRLERKAAEEALLTVTPVGGEEMLVPLREGGSTRIAFEVEPSTEVWLTLKANGYLLRGRGKSKRASYPVVAYKILAATDEASGETGGKR